MVIGLCEESVGRELCQRSKDSCCSEGGAGRMERRRAAGRRKVDCRLEAGLEA